MTRAERVRAALAGETPDRTPFALWLPLPPGVTDGDGFVRAVLKFDEAYAPDLLKLPPPAPWPLPEGSGEQRLKDLRRVAELLGGDAPPMLETLPAPLPGARAHGVSAAWATAAIAEGGCAGAFLVRPESGWSPRWHPALAGRLRAAGAWCLVAHAHDAPEGVLPTWADAFSGPPEALASAPPGTSPMGGIDERLIASRTADEVRAEARAAVRRYGSRLILAPGCTVPPWTPKANLRAIREAAEAPETE